MKLFRWLKHAKQRIQKGYSYRDVWSIDYWFLTVVPQMLEEFANEKYLGIPGHLVLKAEEEHPEMTPDERDEWAINQWRYTCRQIAHHLREAFEPQDEVNEYEEEYFKSWSLEDINKPDENPELTAKYRKRSLEIMEYQQKELEEGMKMFTENLGNLWW